MLAVEHRLDLVSHRHLLEHHQVLAIDMVFLHQHVEILHSLRYLPEHSLGVCDG